MTLSSAEASTVAVEDREYVRTLRLNRPDRGNAWGPDMSAGVTQRLQDAQADAGVRACIITGSGDRAFSSGADLGDPTAHARDIGSELARLQPAADPTFQALLNFSKPVVAAVNGYAIGAGFLLALCCDAILVSESAKFAIPQVSLGMLPAYGGLPRLAQWIGRGRAMDIALTGRRVGAAEAERIGLALSVSKPGELMDNARTYAVGLAALPPLSAKLAKESLLFALEVGTLRMSAAADLYRSLSLERTEDTVEAHTAWRERRRPNYRGR
jgi:enoyl-CoA hydratase/carnithine racemase